MSAPSPDQQHLTVAVEEAAEVTRIRVTGDLSMSTLPQLARRAQPVADRKASLVIDLSELSFIDSMGMSFLLSLHRRAVDEGWDLGLERPSPGVFQTFEIAALDLVLPWVDAAR